MGPGPLGIASPRVHIVLNLARVAVVAPVRGTVAAAAKLAKILIRVRVRVLRRSVSDFHKQHQLLRAGPPSALQPGEHG